MSLNDMTLSPEVLAAVEKLGNSGFNLKPPDGIARDDKGNARWQELVTVEDAHRQSVTGSLGQQRVQFILKGKVVPYGSNGTSSNVGRLYTLFILVNFGAARGDNTTLGSGDMGKEQTMTSISLRRLKQLLAAVGTPLTSGVNGEMLAQLFPENGAGTSPLVGLRLVYGVRDNEKQKTPKGENKQDVENILRAPEGT